MAICETCDYANRPPYKSPCSECDKTIGSPFCCYEHEEKPTNADRIRSMSDEELAEMLVRYDGVYDVYRTDGEGVHYDWDAAVNEELEWLKQPSEQKVIKNYKKVVDK